MALRAALAGVGPLPQCWTDVSRARSVTGRHRLVLNTSQCTLSLVRSSLEKVAAPQLGKGML
jgi:hypothetical protein